MSDIEMQVVTEPEVGIKKSSRKVFHIPFFCSTAPPQHCILSQSKTRLFSLIKLGFFLEFGDFGIAELFLLNLK
jgi:hypothetical protein